MLKLSTPLRGGTYFVLTSLLWHAPVQKNSGAISTLLHIGEHTGRVVCGRTTGAIRRRLILLGRGASLYVRVLECQQPLRSLYDILGASDRGHDVLMETNANRRVNFTGITVSNFFQNLWK